MDPGRAILTPHPGEAARLLGVSVEDLLADTAACAESIALRYGATTVVKGSQTWIAEGKGRSACLDGRTASLGTAGSGDVLSGIATAFLARGMRAFEAARAAVLVHSETGRLCQAIMGDFLAEDLLERISAVTAEAEGGECHA